MGKGGFANMAIAVGFFLVYYLMLIGGEQLADRRLFSPLLAMWLPNLILGAIGVYLTASVMGIGPSRGMR
jgi:lipopolysaccharide export system permease protein